MSELKATTAQEIIRNEKDCDYMDELFGGVKMPPTQVYLKSEADAFIAKLEENHKMEVGQLLIEIVELKAEINRKNGVCKRWFERCMEARTENVKLKRALYKACANWAHVAVAFFSSYTTKEKWRKMENKCRIKAEEYK